MRSPWIIEVGHKSNDMYICKSETEGCFTMLGRYFLPRKHKKMGRGERWHNIYSEKDTHLQYESSNKRAELCLI